MMNFLALVGWNPGTEQELFSMEELISTFDIAQVGKSPGAFNEEKLKFVNREWMRALSDDEYLRQGSLQAPDINRLLLAVPLLKERASTFSEARNFLSGELSCLFEAPEVSGDVLRAHYPVEKSLSHLALIEAIISDLTDVADVETIKSACMVYADTISKEDGGRGAVLWPLRYVLSGQERSPDPFTLIHIIGKAETLLRLQHARKNLAFSSS